MAIVPRLPKLPKIKLPALPKLKLALPVLAIAGLTIAARAKIICSLVTAAFSPLQKAFQQISNLTGTVDSLQSKVRSGLNAVKNLIKDQVTNLVDQAVAPVAQSLKALANLPNSVVSAFNNAKNNLSKQSKNVKSLVEGELNCISENLTTSSKVGAATATIKKVVVKETEKLSNKEKKEILEDPKKKEQFVEKVTEKAVTETTSSISSNVNSSYPAQISAVDKLNATSVTVVIEFDQIYEVNVTTLNKYNRRELVGLLKDRVNNIQNYYSNETYPQLKAARVAELERLLSDLTAKYIKNPNFVIVRDTKVTKLL